ncbi:MAG: T9SS type A sorting domain-containing protein, partial [Ignavibacteriae bacterium]|nr:T9SS type A sorting domain-containing protein [Ignavibacteriota bacterium]
HVLFTQTILHPWKTIDRGGGKSTSGEVTLRASIGQPAVRKMTYIDTGDVLESGFLPGVRLRSGVFMTREILFANGWNLISVPLSPDDFRTTALFPSAISSAFGFDNGYNVKDTLENGVGYWLKFSGEQSGTVSGSSVTSDTIEVNTRWNLIGALAYPILSTDVTAIPPLTITSNIFGYDGGYFTADTLQPGKGYWVKVSQAGKVVLKAGSLLLNSTQPLTGKSKRLATSFSPSRTTEDGLSNLTLADADGKRALLYFSSMQSDIEVERYELPPPPPSGVFDVRFATQHSVAIPDAKKTGEQTFTIHISGAKFPIEIVWENSANAELSIDGKIVSLAQSGKTQISNATEEGNASIKLKLNPPSTTELPKEFALMQNYPNPFNPATVIRYALPAVGQHSILSYNVTLKIYNTLGQEIATLVDEIQEAGYKSVTWDASGITSGLYFFRIIVTGDKDNSQKFTRVNKMMLLR